MKKLLILLTVLLVLGTSCKKDFLSVDETNPNSASAVPANQVLPAALNTTARITTRPASYSFIYLWYGCWCVSPGYSQPSNLTQYNLISSDYQADWDNIYLNLANYDYVAKNSTTDQAKPALAIAKIMKAYLFQMLVDAYGNVPYKDALKAGQGILKPTFDDQQSIYEDLVLQLDDAMNLINTAPADAIELGTADIVYGGDMSKWLKFANTLKLRLLLNQVSMSGRASYISAALATTPHTTADYIGVGDGAMSNPGYVQSTDKMNPFWETFYKQDNSPDNGLGYYMAGQDACDFLNDNDDPRKLLIFAPISGTTIKGNYFGALLLGTAGSTSLIGPGLLKSYKMSAPLLTDFESLFIQAEAVQRNLITGNAKDLYESGVTQSIVYLGGTSAGAAAYLSQAGKPLVNFASATDPIETIITQKWIALNGVDAMPIWTDYRRTHFPSFIHFTQDAAKLNATPPVRLLYPQTEISSNNVNVLAQGTINMFTTHIFWDPFQK